MELDKKQMILNEMIEVSFESNKFLVIKETLERIGIANNKTKTLVQSCYLLFARGRYFIAHFSELFRLDQRPYVFTEEDEARRNHIATLLQEWGLLTILNPEVMQYENNFNDVTILTHKEREDWEFNPVYTIGKFKAKK